MPWRSDLSTGLTTALDDDRLFIPDRHELSAEVRGSGDPKATKSVLSRADLGGPSPPPSYIPVK